MVDEWRKKTYYRPRVLIDTGRILDSPFEGTLLCVTGAQLELLRNLTQYLHRRSTFASEYDTGYYLAPTNAEWDSLQAIVADLEEELMGCETLAALLEQIRICVCETAQAITSVHKVSPYLAPIIEDYIDDGAMQPADTYGADTALEAERCAIAQLTFYQSWAWLTEFIQPVQENSVDILIPLAMVAIASMIGTPVLGIPTGLLLAFIWNLSDVWMEGSLAMVQNALWSNQEELVCAIWAGLATDYTAASTAADAVIDNIDGLSPIDILVFRAMYSPWAIQLAAKGHANETDWAIANVIEGACDSCTWWVFGEWTFPPCPQAWTGTFVCSVYGRPGINGGSYANSPEFDLPSPSTPVDIDVDFSWYSRHGIGWTVGYVVLEYQDVEEDWHTVASVTINNYNAPGTEQHLFVEWDNKTIPRNVLRVNIRGQPGQGTSNPWPVEPTRVKMVFTPHI